MTHMTEKFAPRVAPPELPCQPPERRGTSVTMLPGALPARLSRSRARALGLLVTLLCLSLVRPVQAHPDLDNAKRLASELELEASLAAFERALASGTLKRAELIELLSERAFVLHALHKKSDLVENFIWLSALDPNHRLDLRAPPDLTAIWTSVRDQGRGMLKLTLEAIADDKNGLHARATPSGTVPEGVHTQIVLRKEGGSFETKDSAEVRGPAQAGSTIELYAQAIGLGKVVVAEAYSKDSPLSIRVTHASEEAAVPLLPSEKPVDETPSWARRNRGWIIGAAAVVVVAGAVVGGVLAAKNKDDNSDKTTLEPGMISW